MVVRAPDQRASLSIMQTLQQRLRYAGMVKVSSRSAGCKVLHYGLGTLICALLLFFAVGTKLAAYHSKDSGSTPLASTKIWSTKSAKAPQVPATVEQTAGQPAALFAVILLLLLPVAVELRARRFSLSLPSHFDDILSLPASNRPPPVR
ncbi:MAG TPA: hypothetical protein VGN16_21660 [Acidobacteriaceae bacterium]